MPTSRRALSKKPHTLPSLPNGQRQQCNRAKRIEYNSLLEPYRSSRRFTRSTGSPGLRVKNPMNGFSVKFSGTCHAVRINATSIICQKKKAADASRRTGYGCTESWFFAIIFPGSDIFFARPKTAGAHSYDLDPGPAAGANYPRPFLMTSSGR